jgi:hypothetical protein
LGAAAPARTVAVTPQTTQETPVPETIIPASQMDNFISAIRDSYPGGKHIADHVNDGPWSAVVCHVGEHSKHDPINWLVEYVLDVYDTHDFAHHDGVDVESAKVVIVPEFADELLNWHSNSETPFYVVWDNSHIGPFDTKPTEAQVIARLGDMFSHDVDDEAFARLGEMTDLAGLYAHSEHLLDQAPSPEEYSDFLQALPAALLPRD